MDEGASDKTNDLDKERFIDVLLVVMSLVFAGSSDMNGNMFYYVLFVFLTFAIVTRALMTFKPKHIGNSTTYNLVYSFTSFITAAAFPSAFVSYFYWKLSSELGIFSSAMFLASIVVVFGLASFIFMSLVDVSNQLSQLSEIISHLGVKDEKTLWILCWIIFCIVIFVLTAITWLFMGSSKQLSEHIIQNTFMTIEDGSLGGVSVILSSLAAAIIGALIAGFFTLTAVHLQETTKMNHRKKCIATGFYLEIEALEKIINSIMEGIKKHDYIDEETGKVKKRLGSAHDLNQIIMDEKIILTYKQLYPSTGIYFQFIKDIYILDDKSIKDILYFYQNLLAADNCYRFYKRNLHSKDQKANNIAWGVQVDFFGYIIELYNAIGNLKTRLGNVAEYNGASTNSSSKTNTHKSTGNTEH